MQTMELLNQECYNDVDGILSSLSEVVNKRLAELDRVMYRTQLETQYCKQFVEILTTQLQRVKLKEKMVELKHQLALEQEQKKSKKLHRSSDPLGDLLENAKYQKKRKCIQISKQNVDTLSQEFVFGSMVPGVEGGAYEKLIKNQDLSIKPSDF